MPGTTLAGRPSRPGLPVVRRGWVTWPGPGGAGEQRSTMRFCWARVRSRWASAWVRSTAGTRAARPAAASITGEGLPRGTVLQRPPDGSAAAAGVPRRALGGIAETGGVAVGSLPAAPLGFRAGHTSTVLLAVHHGDTRAF